MEGSKFTTKLVYSVISFLFDFNLSLDFEKKNPVAILSHSFFRRFVHNSNMLIKLKRERSVLCKIIGGYAPLSRALTYVDHF